VGIEKKTWAVGDKLVVMEEFVSLDDEFLKKGLEGRIVEIDKQMDAEVEFEFDDKRDEEDALCSIDFEDFKDGMISISKAKELR
jgi:hypothetical protein